jgi:hypothetical protein
MMNTDKAEQQTGERIPARVHHSACNVNFAWAKGCNCNGGQIPMGEGDAPREELDKIRLERLDKILSLQAQAERLAEALKTMLEIVPLEYRVNKATKALAQWQAAQSFDG